MPIEKTRILAHLKALRESRPGHFWALTGVGTFSLMSMVTAFAVVPGTEALAPQPPTQTLVQEIALPAPALANAEQLTLSREERVRAGDTVFTLMRRLGIDDAEAESFMRSNATARVLHSRIRPGQLVSARTDEDGELLSLAYPISSDTALMVERKDGALGAAEKPLALQTQTQTRSGVIKSSLFAAADEVGLPDSVAEQLAEIFGGEIDFNTDLRKGDRFAVVYESFTHEGREVRTGRILAAEFVNGGETFNAVWFEQPGRAGSYYTPDGRSLKKAFLRSPLEFSRVTSGFSMRLHPVFKDWRAHKGVDFAAPIGTGVRATADGTIEFIGQQRGYGNFIVLRHHDTYSTAYGHLNAFASGLHQGSRVAQGDVIGYVGRTGWATGPHLHYEFRIAGVHQDPLSVALPVSIPLSAQELARFKAGTAPLVAQLQLGRQMTLARAD